MNNHDKIKQAFGDLKAPDGMAEKILANTGSKSTIVRNPYWKYHINKLAVIAIVCILMTTTALAIAFPELWRIGRLSIHGVIDGSIGILSENSVYPFSENLREYIEQNENKALEGSVHEAYEITFNSFEEASDFFGVPIAKINFKHELPVIGTVFFDTEEDSATVLLSAMENSHSGNEYRVFFGINECSSEPFNLLVRGSDDGTIEDTEIYISQATGIEAAIAFHSKYRYGSLTFSLDDVVYSINMRTGYENFDELADIFKNIVDTVK